MNFNIANEIYNNIFNTFNKKIIEKIETSTNTILSFVVMMKNLAKLFLKYVKLLSSITLEIIRRIHLK